MGETGRIRAVMRLETIEPAGPKGRTITLAMLVAIPTIMLTSRRTTKVFPQRLPTSLLLLPRLFNASIRSIIITGVTKANIMAIMMPGTMRQINPRMIKTPVIIPATSKEASLDTVKLKPT